MNKKRRRVRSELLRSLCVLWNEFNMEPKMHIGMKLVSRLATICSKDVELLRKLEYFTKFNMPRRKIITRPRRIAEQNKNSVSKRTFSETRTVDEIGEEPEEIQECDERIFDEDELLDDECDCDRKIEASCNKSEASTVATALSSSSFIENEVSMDICAAGSVLSDAEEEGVTEEDLIKMFRKLSKTLEL